MNETRNSKFKKRAAALAVASCLTLAPWVAEAAGLGKLTVLSGLGQPLRAELDIGAAKDEVAGMTARLAPQEAFKQAGVDFASVLLDLRFAVEKRPNGQSVVKVTSSKPINEPFLDFLVELNWPAGRLVREYTFLLDPPEIAATQSSRPVAEARIVDTVRGGGSGGESKPAPVRAAPRSTPRATPAPKVAAEPKQKPDTAGGRLVRQGETLRKIAAENQYEGVSLEQMLVGLFQSNPDAFIAKNVNRLKAGAILNMPEKSAVEAVSPADAKRVYVAQASDWNAYRQKLAASTAKMPAKDEAGAAQSSAGKITAKVEEKAVPAEQGKDQVKVARTDAAAKGTAAGKAAEAADQLAKDKALKDAQDRLQSLEKNVNELQKLLDLKSQKLAELQQAPAKKEEPKPVEAVKSAEPPKPVEVPKPAEPKVAEAPKAVETPPVAAPKPPEVKAPVPPKPEQPNVAVPPPPPEPGIIDSLLEDPLPAAGGAGILALLAGYFLIKRRRSQNASVETTALPVPSSLGPNSVFRMTGGQSIDTGNSPPHTGEFSQTGPGTIDTDEVDPVAEADVYMAYGRDTQAEEILLEALQKDPQRTAIHAKLLEIYANRRSVKQFETLAGELYAQSAGVGPDWEKAAALGLTLDPHNPLYSASRAQEATDAVKAGAVEDVPVIKPEVAVQESGSREAAAVLGLSAVGLSQAFERDTVILPKEPESPAGDVTEAVAPNDLDLGSDAMTLDFDLGAETIAPDFMTEPEPVVVDEEAYIDTVVTADNANALDFDFDNEPTPEAVAVAPPVEEKLANEGIDFDLAVADNALLEESGGTTPDFSPDGTLVLPSTGESEEVDVGLGTWVGGDDAPMHALEETVSLPEQSQDHGLSMTNTVIDPLSGTDTLVSTNVMNFGDDAEEADDAKLADTVVNAGVVDTDALEFDVKLTDSMFLGQPMGTPEFDIGSINLDLATPPAATSFGEETLVHAAASSLDEPLMDSLSTEAPVRNEQWEEVNTKLDLAKAYEEMGDLEGARELLQEVVGEGPVDLVEQARTILGRIGG